MTNEQHAAPAFLVVVAHPDDEVLGCGATVRLLVARGWRGHLLVMSKGVAGRSADPAADPGLAAQEAGRAAEMRRAADVLGFASVTALDFPDNRFDTVSRMDLSHAIRPKIDEIRPRLVLTHHAGDYNWDHTRTFDAVMMAARPNPPEFAPAEIRAFEVPSSTERAWQDGDRAFRPNAYVDVGRTIDFKKRALRYYASEYRPYPHPRSIEAIEYLARKRGNEVGVEYAEAFEIIRSIGIA